MSVNDLLAEQNTAHFHEYRFCLWPRLWREYDRTHGYQFTWVESRFLANGANNVPEEPGLYTFLIQPNIANHPANSYLMYIGMTKKLRNRYKDYLKEMRRETGRPRIVNLLNKYPDNTIFCYTVVHDNPAALKALERAFKDALVPPCNPGELSVRVRRIVEAFR